MVKFGKKFFFNAAYEKKTRKRLIIGGIILAIVIIALIILIVTIINKNKEKSPNKISSDILLRNKITSEVNAALPDKASYFEKLANIDLDKITITYPDEMKVSVNASKCPADQLEEINNILDGTKDGNIEDFQCIYYVPTQIGTFEVNINLNNKDYKVNLDVKDLTGPNLKLKPLEITAGDTYTVNDFVESCTDNYDDSCYIDYYYNSYEENENGLDYSAITTEGSYTIKIKAVDSSENSTLPLETTLTVKPKAPNKYLVTFDSKGGTNVNGEYVEEGLAVAKPANPTKNGYTFKAWTLNGQTYDFSTPVTNDITLVAEWTKKQSSGGGSSTPGCTYGNKNYNTNKFILSVYANQKSDCATSKSEFQTLRDGPLTNDIIVKDVNRLKSSLDSSYYPGYETLGVFNTSGKGLVGYQITVTIQHKVNERYTEVARYRIDTKGKRHFTLNTINLPE